MPSQRGEGPGNAGVRLNAATMARWERVSARMAAAGRAPVEWRFSVTPDAAVNATSWADGRVSVTAALLRFVQSDDELAAVLAHEMAHVELRHGQKRAVAGAATLLAAAAVAWAAHELADASAWESGGLAAGAIFTLSPAVLLPGQRAHELEADLHSLVILRRTGYDPRGAVAFWERYAALRRAAGDDGRASVFSAHPPDDARLEALRGALGLKTPLPRRARGLESQP